MTATEAATRVRLVGALSTTERLLAEVVELRQLRARLERAARTPLASARPWPYDLCAPPRRPPNLWLDLYYATGCALLAAGARLNEWGVRLVRRGS